MGAFLGDKKMVKGKPYTSTHNLIDAMKNGPNDMH